MSDIRNERIEVLLEEVSFKLNTVKQKYSHVLEKIVEVSKVRGFEVPVMANYVKETATFCCQSILKLVQDQIVLVTDNEKKSIYSAQLDGIRDDLKESMELPYKMAIMKSECDLNQLIFGASPLIRF